MISSNVENRHRAFQATDYQQTDMTRFPALLIAFIFAKSSAIATASWQPDGTTDLHLSAAWTNDVSARRFLDYSQEHDAEFKTLSNRARNPRSEAFPEIAARLLKELNEIPISEAETDFGGLLVERRTRLVLICMWHAEGTNAVPMLKTMASELGAFRKRIVPAYQWKESSVNDDGADDNPPLGVSGNPNHDNLLQRELRTNERLRRRRLFEVGMSLFPTLEENGRQAVWKDIAAAARMDDEERKAFLSGKKQPAGIPEWWPIRYSAP